MQLEREMVRSTRNGRDLVAIGQPCKTRLKKCDENCNLAEMIFVTTFSTIIREDQSENCAIITDGQKQDKRARLGG